MRQYLTLQISRLKTKRGFISEQLVDYHNRTKIWTRKRMETGEHKHMKELNKVQAQDITWVFGVSKTKKKLIHRY
jgi:hypothetical protein